MEKGNHNLNLKLGNTYMPCQKFYLSYLNTLSKEMVQIITCFGEDDLSKWKQMEKITHQYDNGMSKTVEYHEFLAMLDWIKFFHGINKSQHTSVEIKNTFKKFDTDSKGTVSKEVFKQVMAKLGMSVTKEVEEMVEEIPKLEGNDEISYEEFVTIWGLNQEIPQIPKSNNLKIVRLI